MPTRRRLLSPKAGSGPGKNGALIFWRLHCTCALLLRRLNADIRDFLHELGYQSAYPTFLQQGLPDLDEW